MKYHAPTQGPYEEGLTTQMMYDVVETLINRHFSPPDIDNAKKILSKDRLDYNSSNLWKKPEIRSELEEFVESYFFSELDRQLPGFREVFIRNYEKQENETLNDFSKRMIAKQKERLGSYIDLLEQEYGSREEAYKIISDEFNKLIMHKDKMVKEGNRFKEIDRDILIGDNANEAYKHILSIFYGRLENAMHDVGIKPQS